MLEVEVISSRKGSNPGGLCNIRDWGRTDQCYVKFCPGSRLPKGSSLNAAHQPIYEAMTSVMARGLGLLTANFYILDNTSRDIKFRNSNGNDEGIGENRDFYFASKIIPKPQQASSPKLEAAISKDEVYLDLLGIGDVVGKLDNFKFEEENERIIYIDLGCNFVRAKEGRIEIKQRTQQKMQDRQLLKRVEREISSFGIIPIDQTYPIRLTDFINRIPYLSFPTLNPKKILTVNSVLPQPEISEIQKIVTLEVHDAFCKHRKTSPETIVRL